MTLRMLKADLNTSYVDIKHMVANNATITGTYLNTSYVDIKLMG